MKYIYMLVIFCRSTQQDLFNALGSIYSAVMFIGVQNSQTVQPIVDVERTVFYREKAAGMYSPIPYAFAQVRALLITLPFQGFKIPSRHFLLKLLCLITITTTTNINVAFSIESGVSMTQKTNLKITQFRIDQINLYQLAVQEVKETCSNPS